jgi:hypothetical protein
MENNTIQGIRDIPNCYVNESGQLCHESLLQAWNILQKVKSYCLRGVPSDVLLELIEAMQDPSAKKEECAK